MVLGATLMVGCSTHSLLREPLAVTYALCRPLDRNETADPLTRVLLVTESGRSQLNRFEGEQRMCLSATSSPCRTLAKPATQLHPNIRRSSNTLLAQTSSNQSSKQDVNRTRCGSLACFLPFVCVLSGLPTGLRCLPSCLESDLSALVGKATTS
jgi:hypothetical protein